MIDVRGWARAYIALGWPVVLLPPLAKGPVGDDWPTRTYTENDFAPGDNIGIQLGRAEPGKVELVDVDCDCPEAIALAPAFLPATATFGRWGDGKTPGVALSYAQAGPRRHWLYACVGATTRKPRVAHVELRARSRKGASGLQTMAPGSIHPDTHEPIVWVDAPATGPAVVAAPELDRAFVRLAIATVVARAWASPSLQGQRHDAALAFAGALWHAGWSVDEAASVLLPAWSLTGDADAPHREQAIRDTWDGDSGRQRWGMPALAKLLDDASCKALQQHIGDAALGLRGRASGGESVEVHAAAHGLESPADMPHRNHVGNAELLARMHGANLRWVEGVGWLRWDTARWVLDPQGPTAEAAELAARLVAYGSALTGDEGKAWVQWGVKSGMARDVAGGINMLKAHATVRRSVEQLDSDAWLLGTPTGVVDLRTGMLRPAMREDLITRQCGVGYDPAAPMPARFARFLDEVMCGRAELGAYLLRFLGHCLTGDVREHVLSIWHGAQGGNGKGTLLGVMQRILGDYAGTAAPALLMQSSSTAHPTGLWDLRGKRLVLTNETPEGQRWNESLVKTLTGGDVVKARGMRQDFVQFEPTWKLVVATNSRPLVRESGGSFWRRVHLVPWHASFTGREDRDLDRVLASEAPGVLRWLVHGCGQWLAAGGLCPPDEVRAASEDYRESQDTIGSFLRDAVVADEQGWCPRPELFGAYRRWCETGGEHALGRQAFGRVLQDRGWHVQVRNGQRGFRGWRLLPQTW